MVSLLDDAQSKKPHLRLKGGVWSCRTHVLFGRHIVGFRVGYGYSPKEAYEDWRWQ